MSYDPSTATPASVERNRARNAVAGTTTIAAGALLFVSALLTLLQGISALASDNLLIVTSDYIYRFNTTTWGWIHIVVGVLLLGIAVGMMAGRDWARLAAIFIASLSIVVMFLWMPYYPVWSLVVIALDVIVIWAVATWNTDPRY